MTILSRRTWPGRWLISVFCDHVKPGVCMQWRFYGSSFDKTCALTRIE